MKNNRSDSIFRRLLNHIKENRNEYANTAMQIAFYVITRLLKKKVDKRYLDKNNVGVDMYNKYWSTLLINSLDEINSKQKRDLIKKFNLETYLKENKEMNKLLFESTNLNGNIFIENEYLELENGTKIIMFDSNLEDEEIYDFSFKYHQNYIYNEFGVKHSVYLMLERMFHIYKFTDFDAENIAYYLGEYFGVSLEQTEKELANFLAEYFYQ